MCTVMYIEALQLIIYKTSLFSKGQVYPVYPSVCALYNLTQQNVSHIPIRLNMIIENMGLRSIANALRYNNMFFFTQECNMF